MSTNSVSRLYQSYHLIIVMLKRTIFLILFYALEDPEYQGLAWNELFVVALGRNGEYFKNKSKYKEVNGKKETDGNPWLKY